VSPVKVEHVSSIHDLRPDAFEYAWDNSIEPALEVQPGAVVELHVRDASDEQIDASSGPDDVAKLDFSHVNPVSGPVFVLDDPRSVTLGSEPVRVDGDLVGRVTSGGYGYTVERSIAYAYVPADVAAVGHPVEVEIFGQWIAGQVAKEPLRDTAGERIRA
jgi:hypothetical protein